MHKSSKEKSEDIQREFFAHAITIIYKCPTWESLLELSLDLNIHAHLLSAAPKEVGA